MSGGEPLPPPAGAAGPSTEVGLDATPSVVVSREVRRRRVALTLRVAVSVVMLAVLLGRVPHLESLVPQWSASALWWLSGAAAVTLLGIVLSTLRWQQVLAALGVRTGIRPLLSHYLAGQFVSNFLPSTIGGDVLRVTRLSAGNGQGPSSFASVVLERLSGWIVLPVITIVGLLVNPELLRLGSAGRLALAIALGTLALLAVVVLVATHPRLGGRLATSEGWTRFLGAVHLGLERLRTNPSAALGVLATGFAYQLSVVVAALLAVQALGLEVGFTAVLAFMPAVAIAQVMPISFGGLGIREGAFVLFLQPLGVAQAEAITLGLLVYALNLGVSLLGAPAFATGSRPTRPAV